MRRPVHHLRQPEGHVVDDVHRQVELAGDPADERRELVGRNGLVEEEDQPDAGLLVGVLAGGVPVELVAGDAGEPHFEVLDKLGRCVVAVEGQRVAEGDVGSSAAAVLAVPADPVAADVLEVVLLLFGEREILLEGLRRLHRRRQTFAERAPCPRLVRDLAEVPATGRQLDEVAGERCPLRLHGTSRGGNTHPACP